MAAARFKRNKLPLESSETSRCQHSLGDGVGSVADSELHHWMLTNSPESSDAGRLSINSKYHTLNEHIELILSDSGMGPVCHVEKFSERIGRFAE